MSQSFFGGDGKGSTSAIKKVGARLERDYSLHQDRLISRPSPAGPSQAKQRSNRHAINHATALQSSSHAQAFDLSALQDNLVFPSANASRENWANGFSQRPPAASNPAAQVRRASPWQNDFNQYQQSQPRGGSPAPTTQAPWQRPQAQPYRPAYTPVIGPQYSGQQPYFTLPPTSMHVTPPQTFPARPSPPQYASPQTTDRIGETYAEVPAEPLNQPQELLARTARSLTTDLDNSTILQENPKLAQSDFMQLLRGLGNREVAVKEGELGDGDEVGQGAQFVKRSVGAGWAGDFLGETAPTGTIATPVLTATTLPALNGEPTYAQRQRSQLNDLFGDQDALTMRDDAATTIRPSSSRRKSVHFEDLDETTAPALGSGVPDTLEQAAAHTTSMPGTQQQTEDPSFDNDDEFDYMAFMNYNGQMRQAASSRIGVGDLEGWTGMQNDWEALQREESGENGIREMSGQRYLFQSRNPYATMGEDTDMGRESPTIKGVLELEAEVQKNPTEYEAWYHLGLKQQENEREDQAIRALLKTVELEPDYRPVYLALAVSYTNENQLELANTMLAKWIDLGDGGGEGSEQVGPVDRGILVRRLIDMARMKPDEVEADVQIALGVLFNASDEYEKAEDCFSAALAVRPDDWLLHNRLGATLANSGRSNEAISHYHRALALHPNFVRARFNLGISYINLGQYTLAANQILSALRLQHSDATEGYATGTLGGAAKGVGSESLWAGLRTACLHMGRHDLVELVVKKDISAEGWRDVA